LASGTSTLTVTTSGSGTVLSDPSGVDCDASCSVAFPTGTPVTLTAQPAAGQVFYGWGGACSGVGNCNVTLSAAQSVTAAFRSASSGADYVLSVNQAGTGTVTSTPSGIQCQSSCSASFANASSVSLAAQAGAGYTFAGWGGACSGTASCTVAMNSDQTVSATFTQAAATDYVLTVSDTGSGTVVVNPGASNCTGSCATSFASGTAVTLSAQPASGYAFDGWGGACSGTATCSVTMNQAQSVSAAFSKIAATDYSLVVSETGSGTVSSSPSGISCGTSCTGSYTSGTAVTLSAQPAAGYAFSGWSGACSGTGTCAVTMSATKSVSATFVAAPVSYTLTVANPGSGGTISSTPGGISCASACSSSYTAGTVVTLTEQAASGHSFGGWGGACTGSASSCTVTMSAAQSVSASFSSSSTSTFVLTTTTAGTGSGTISSSPSGISCGSTCSSSFNSGTAVTLSAQAASGSTFSGWSGACTGTGACAVTMSASQSVSATFAAGSTTSPSSLSIKVSSSGGHLVDANGNTVQLRGVNVSALESYIANLSWSPSNPWAGQTGTATPNWTLIANTWGANAVRIPLNEADWLDSGTYQNASGGSINADPDGIYKQTVDAAITAANAAGLYVILDLHWAAPTNYAPTIQNAMADRPNSINFWSSVAARYKSNPAVLFELFNEPFLDVAGLTNTSSTDTAGYFLLNGGGALDKLLWTGSPGETTVSWTTAGYQEMLNAVRAAGAPNVVLTGTMNWTTTMNQWLTYKPTDVAPAGYSGTWTSQLGATWHAYPASGYPTQVSCIGLPSCSAQMFTAVQAIMAAGYPVVITEYGDTISSGTTAPWASVLLPWADTNGVSYLGWTFDSWSGFNANVLITDAAGDPTPGYGAYVKQHYLCRRAATASCP
jgi:uncharacterized repeat protein (TIGR02543 family)